MHWIWIALGVLVALVIVAFVAGSFLPRAHAVSRTRDLAAPPAAVWSVIHAFEEYAQWVPEVERVERLADRDGHEVWREVRKDGWGFAYETVEAEAPRRLVRRIADPKSPVQGSWTFELTPTSAGTTLTITERGELANPFFRLFLAFGDEHATIDAFLAALERRLRSPAVGTPREAGETDVAR